MRSVKAKGEPSYLYQAVDHKGGHGCFDDVSGCLVRGFLVQQVENLVSQSFSAQLEFG